MIKPLKPPEGNKWLIMRRRINHVLAKLQKQYGFDHPALRLTTQQFAESLDQGHPDCLPITSRKCPMGATNRLDTTYFALLEGVVRSFWKKEFGNLVRLLPLLEEIERIELKNYKVLGCARTGFYLFLPGMGIK